MLKKIILILIPIFLTACAVRTGILVEMEDKKTPLLGEAVATLVSGDFHVESLDGYSCSGTYDQYTQTSILKVNVKCSDGRYGEVAIMRTGPNLRNGSGEGRLNDGARFRVLLGDMIHYRGVQGFWEKMHGGEAKK